MLRTMIAICISAALCLIYVTGCSKEQPKQAPKAPTQTQAPAQAPAPAPAPAEEQPKTEAEYKAQADKEITQENAAQELDKLEKSVDEDAAKTQ